VTQIDWNARLQEELDRPPFNQWLAAVPVAVDSEKRIIEVRLPFRSEFSHHPTQHVFHGGVLSALADVAGHAAVAVFHGSPTPTITLQIDYLAPAVGNVLFAKGILRKLGRSLSRSDVELVCGEKLVAIARGTFSTQERTR
jgi:uncharacterized protein (TIGR00369 family)